MDQPTVTIRRHNSLPARVRRSTPTLQRMSRQMKFNPYVGWFRHSPDTSDKNKPRRIPKFLRHNMPSCSLMALKALPLQDSRYEGFFVRQFPSKLSGAHCILKEMQDEFLTLLEVTKCITVTQDHVQELADFLAGRLRGGSPYFSSANDSYKGRNTLTTYNPYYSQNLDPSEAASRFLTRIASWVLAPFLFEDEDNNNHNKPKIDHRDLRSSSHSSLKSLDNESLTTVGPEDTGHEEDDDDLSEYSNYSGHYAAEPTTPPLADFVNPREGYLRSSSLGGESTMAARDAVSSQAEAYYAHQAARDLNPDEVIPSRLDYVITQMDIIRMQRNASRHLDVESICQLPTITYLKNHAKKVAAPTPANSQEQQQQQQDDSWMLVSNSAEDQGASEISPGTSPDTDVCVICLEHFAYGDRLRVLPCNHSFHTGCIDRWLSGSSSFDECHTSGCPTCKKRPMREEPPPQEEGTLRADGSVPSWAFCQLGSVLMARDSQQS